MHFFHSKSFAADLHVKRAAIVPFDVLPTCKQPADFGHANHLKLKSWYSNWVQHLPLGFLQSPDPENSAKDFSFRECKWVTWIGASSSFCIEIVPSLSEAETLPHTSSKPFENPNLRPKMDRDTLKVHTKKVYSTRKMNSKNDNQTDHLKNHLYQFGKPAIFIASNPCRSPKLNRWRNLSKAALVEGCFFSRNRWLPKQIFLCHWIISRMLHGTGIFTYMKGWFLWGFHVGEYTIYTIHGAYGHWIIGFVV